MAADVSRQIKSEGKPGDPITRDFLGGCFGIESKELDLDLHVPAGWEKRLDLKSGKVYIQKSIQQAPPSDHKHTNPINQTLPSSSTAKSKTTLNLFEDTTLDLKLVPNSPSNGVDNHNNATYQSVCTIDKVKSALDRAWRVSSPTSSSSKKRPSPSNSASSSMISINNNNNNNDDLSSLSSSHDHQQQPLSSLGNGNGMLVAGACPGCLMYVLISQTNPRCPKCSSVIPIPVTPKKPKIDLNI